MVRGEGAPEAVLGICAFILAQGEARPLLPEREHPADQNDGDDHVTDLRHSFTWLSPFRDESEPGGDPQNYGEEAEKLADQAHDCALVPALLDLVRPVFYKPPRSLA